MKALNWKRNLYVTWLVQILSITGFGFVIPFPAFCIRDLGVTDESSVKMRTGIIAGVPSVFLGIMAPVWGMLADRSGKNR